MTPIESLKAGADKLRLLLGPHGFQYVPGPTGASSGGLFACGSFVKDGRALEFSVRYGLGQVEYAIDGWRIGHEDYIRFAGQWGRHRYPDFGRSVLESFDA